MITHQARRGGVRAHHLRVADPLIRHGMPVLQRAISPRQARDRDSGEIRELDRITDVEVKSSRDMIKQSDVNDVRHRPSRPTDFSTVESARRAGSCHAGGTTCKGKASWTPDGQRRRGPFSVSKLNRVAARPLHDRLAH
jgi:hypothetical protein